MRTDKRKMGRPKNPNLIPTNARLATTKDALDKLDRMITYARMPLGRKLESALSELEYLRKNLVGQSQVSQPIGLNLHKIYDNSTNELSPEEYNQVWKEFDKEEGIIIE